MTFVNVPYTGDDKILSDSQLRTNRNFHLDLDFMLVMMMLVLLDVSLNYVESNMVRGGTTTIVPIFRYVFIF